MQLFETGIENKGGGEREGLRLELGLLGSATSGLLGSRAVLADELLHGLGGAVTVVGEGVGLVVGGVEEEGGEALDVDGGVVLGAVDLGDDDVGLGLKGLAELLVLRGEGLAVAAPGSVELDEDVLVGVHDDRLEGLADDDGNGAVVVRGDGLRADGGGQLAGDVVLRERERERERREGGWMDDEIGKETRKKDIAMQWR